MLISSWAKDVQSLPETYVFPPEQRPMELIAPASNNPIVDLDQAVKHHCSDTIQKILKAGQDFSFFQVYFPNFCTF